MMKRTWIVALALLFVSAAAFAETPRLAPVSGEVLAAILAQPAAGGACGEPMSEARFVAKLSGQTKSLCTATANCDTGTVSCQGNSSCTAVDRDCSSLERGHVTCDGVTTSCTPLCCSTGTLRQRACCRCDATGSCYDCTWCAYGSPQSWCSGQG